MLTCVLILFTVQLFGLIYFETICPDSKAYFQLSKNLYNDGNYSYDGEQPARIRQPLYPIFLLIFYQLPGQCLAIVIIMQVILNLIGYYLLLKISYIIFRGRIPTFLPYILAGYLPLWTYSTRIMTEGLFIFLTICSLYFLTMLLKRMVLKYSFLAGIIAGLAFLTRLIGLGYIIVLISIPVILSKKLKNTHLHILIMAAAIIIICLPWIIRNQVEFGKLTPFSSDASFHLYYASLPDSVINAKDHIKYHPDSNPDLIADSLKFLTLAFKSYGNNPFHIILKGIKNLITIWAYFPGTREIKDIWLKSAAFALQWGILLFAIYGFFRTTSYYRLILIAPAIGYSIGFFFTYATTRFAIPAMPFILILSSVGLECMRKKIRPAGHISE